MINTIKNYFKSLKYIVFIIILFVIFFNSLANLYEKREKIFYKIIDPLNTQQKKDRAKETAAKKAQHDHEMDKGRVEQRYLINPSKS